MDINELKLEKMCIEGKIIDLVRNFNEKTGVNIKEIIFQPVFDASYYDKCHVLKYKINIELDL